MVQEKVGFSEKENSTAVESRLQFKKKISEGFKVCPHRQGSECRVKFAHNCMYNSTTAVARYDIPTQPYNK